MSTTGEIFGTAASTTSETPYDDNAWADPTYALTDDSNQASITPANFDTDDYSQVLRVYTFDFSAIPDGSTINGVTCRINCWYADGAASGVVLQLLDTSGTRTGTNQWATPVPWSTSTSTVETEGGSSDTWGLSLTSAWVKNSNFGIGLAVQATADNADVFVNYISLEIDYTGAVTPEVDEAESVGVSATATVAMQGTQAEKAESVQVSDAPTVAIGAMVVIESDSVQISDTVVNIQVIDPSPGDKEVTEAESVQVSDSITVEISALSISVSETIGIGASPSGGPVPTIAESESIQVSDKAAHYTELVVVTDKATVYVVPTGPAANEIDKTESIGVSAAATVRMAALQISVSETVGIGDVPSARPTVEVGVSDSTQVSDGTPEIDIGAEPPALVSKTESVTVSDTATVRIAALRVSLSESVGIGDDSSARPRVNIDESESVGVSDTDKAELVSLVDEAESVGVSDSPVARPGVEVSGAESVGASDTSKAELVSLISEAEAIGVGDVPGAALESLEIAEAESVQVSDGTQMVVVAALEIQVSETVIVGAPAPIIDVGAEPPVTISKAETISVSDTAAVGLSALEIVASESVGIQDSPAQATGTLAIVASESVDVGDNATASIPVLPDRNISVSETIGVSDSPIVAAVSISAAVSESVIISDGAIVRTATIALSVSESLQVSDTAQVSVSAPGQTLVTVSDGVGVSDTPLVEVSDLSLMVSDGVGISDTPLATIGEATPVSVFVSDSLAVSDSLSLPTAGVGLGVSESIGVGDSALAQGGLLAIFVAAAISVSDTAQQLLVTRDLFFGVSSSVGVSDSATVSVIPVRLRVTLSDQAVGNLSGSDEAVGQISLEDILTGRVDLSDN